MRGLSNLLALALATPKILIFSRTLGYRHASIPNAIAALKAHGGADVTFDATEDPTVFTSANLALYDAVLFLMTTDSSDSPRVEVLGADEKVSDLVCGAPSRVLEFVLRA